MTLLFAYASNLNREHMLERCPAAEVLDTATLAEHRLVFRYGADLEPHPGAAAVGVVWRLNADDTLALDHYEGCPSLYRKDFRHVQLAGGEAVEVMLYRMNREGYAPPPEDYLELIRDGYRDFGLSEVLLDAAVELSSKLRPVATGPLRRPGLH
jgi:hypothetical protein